MAGRGVVLTDRALETHSVLWSNGTQLDLGVRMGSSAVNVAPINDAGRVAGVVTRLPWLAGGMTVNGGVIGINASGTVLGCNASCAPCAPEPGRAE